MHLPMLSRPDNMVHCPPLRLAESICTWMSPSVLHSCAAVVATPQSDAIIVFGRPEDRGRDYVHERDYSKYVCGLFTDRLSFSHGCTCAGTVLDRDHLDAATVHRSSTCRGNTQRLADCFCEPPRLRIRPSVVTTQTSRVVERCYPDCL